MTTTGKCLCGQITVFISKDTFNADVTTGICHCKNCCRAGGSLGSINLIAPESDVQIKGQPKLYEDNATDSGKAAQRYFCGNCGSPIYSASSKMPGVRIVKLSLFDEIPKPKMEIYCKSMPSWKKPIDGIQQFDAAPTQ